MGKKDMLFEKYKDFNVPKSTLEDIYLSLKDIDENSIDFSRIFETQADIYVLKQFKDGQIDKELIMNKYNYVRALVSRSPKYNTDPKKLQKNFESAVELLKKRYDESEPLSHNILQNIKYIVNNDLMEYDISFMNEYFSIYKDELNNVSKNIEIDKDTLITYISGSKKAPKDVVELLCIVFDCDTYDELKDKISKKIFVKKTEILIKKSEKVKKQEKQKEFKKYRVTFLKKYIEMIGLKKEEMCDFLKVNLYTLDKVLDGNFYINEEQLKLLCEYFNVNTFEELKEKITNVTHKEEPKKEEKKEIPKEEVKRDNKELLIKKRKELEVHHKEKEPISETDIKRDLSFMKEYVERFKYDRKKLSELWSCGIGVVDKVLNGDIKIRDSLLWETYTEFKVKNYDELKVEINKRINNLDNNIEKHKKEEERIKQLLEREVVVNIDELSKNKLFDLLNIKNMNYKESMITILLFGGITDKSIDEIAEFLQMSKSYIYDIYIKDLKEIKRIYTSHRDNVKLVYKGKEVD